MPAWPRSRCRFTRSFAALDSSFVPFACVPRGCFLLSVRTAGSATSVSDSFACRRTEDDGARSCATVDAAASGFAWDSALLASSTVAEGDGCSRACARKAALCDLPSSSAAEGSLDSPPKHTTHTHPFKRRTHSQHNTREPLTWTSLQALVARPPLASPLLSRLQPAQQ